MNKVKCVELNRKGNFDRWDPEKLEELKTLDANRSSLNYDLFQDEHVKLSIIILDAYERAPFRVLHHSFDLICLTGGAAITRFSHGGISLVMFEKGEHIHQDIYGKTMVNDLQNVSNGLFILGIIEYKEQLSSLDWTAPKGASELVAI